jgi:hypothetical protein
MRWCGILKMLHHFILNASKCIHVVVDKDVAIALALSPKRERVNVSVVVLASTFVCACERTCSQAPPRSHFSGHTERIHE